MCHDLQPDYSYWKRHQTKDSLQPHWKGLYQAFSPESIATPVSHTQLEQRPTLPDQDEKMMTSEVESLPKMLNQPEYWLLWQMLILFFFIFVLTLLLMNQMYFFFWGSIIPKFQKKNQSKYWVCGQICLVLCLVLLGCLGRFLLSKALTRWPSEILL